MALDSLRHQLNDLFKLLNELDDRSYTNKSSMLGDATIGQHVRHIIELIQCMVKGYEEGRINYDARKRDSMIETNTQFAISQLAELIDAWGMPDKPMLLAQANCDVNTFYYREVVYNTEHAIHHMALIRVALREMQLKIVDDNFGVAPATIQYRKNAYA